MASQNVSFSQNVSIKEYNDDESEYESNTLDPIEDDYAEYFYENDEETSNDKDDFEQQIADSGHDKYAYDSYDIEHEDKPIGDGNDSDDEEIVTDLKENDVLGYCSENDDDDEDVYVDQNENSNEIRNDFTNERYNQNGEEQAKKFKVICHTSNDIVENNIESLKIPDLSIGDEKEKNENKEEKFEDIFGPKISNELNKEGKESKTSMKKSFNRKKKNFAKDVSSRFCPDEYLGGNCPSNCFSPPPRVKLRKSWMNNGNNNNSTSKDIGRLEIKDKGVSYTQRIDDKVKEKKTVENKELINQTQNHEENQFAKEKEIDSRMEQKIKEKISSEKSANNPKGWKQATANKNKEEKRTNQEKETKNNTTKVEKRKNKPMIEKRSPRKNVQYKYNKNFDSEKKQEQFTETKVNITPTVRYDDIDSKDQRKKYSKKTTDKGSKKVESGAKYCKNNGKKKIISELNESQHTIEKPKPKKPISPKNKQSSTSKRSPKSDLNQNKKENMNNRRSIENQKPDGMKSIESDIITSSESSTTYNSKTTNNKVHDAYDIVEEYEKSAHETQELKYRLAKLERQMHVIDVKRISQLADIEEATTRRMSEYRSKLHYNFNRKKKAMLEKKQMMEKQSIQSQGLSGTLRLSNQKLRTEMRKREQSILELKQLNQKLQDGNSSRGCYLDEMNRTLSMEVSAASALNKRLTEDAPKYQELTDILKAGINSRRKSGETENAIKFLNMRCMKKVLDLLIENNYDDPSLLNKINDMDMEEQLGQCDTFDSREPHQISCSSPNENAKQKKGGNFESLSFANESVSSKPMLYKMENQLIPLDSMMMDDDDTASLCSTATSASESSNVYDISDFNAMHRVSIPPF